KLVSTATCRASMYQLRADVDVELDSLPSVPSAVGADQRGRKLIERNLSVGWNLRSNRSNGRLQTIHRRFDLYFRDQKHRGDGTLRFNSISPREFREDGTESVFLITARMERDLIAGLRDGE